MGGEIEPACELLHEVGICDFDPEQLVAMRDSRVFEAGRDALGYYHERLPRASRRDAQRRFRPAT